MSRTDFQRIRELFLAARRLGGPARDLYLSEACADDAALRAEIDSLLANHDRPSAGLIETPVVGSSGTLMIRALSRAPERIGQYRIVRLIGEGAMGSVYEAEQDNPRRRVALKLLRPGLVSAQVLKRFSLEAQILGRLHHPGIAQVYEAGTFGDTDAAIQPYFAMEFIDGPVLARFLAESRPGTRDKLRLIARICDAVQHAHDRAVIHRDLKPANIVVVPGDEPQPKVLDFGVARLADPDHRVTTLQTGIGQIIGTVAYMSPEQARGETTLDARSDVYALGVIAYEALAGRLPYDVSGRPLHDALQVIQSADPAPLSRIDRVFRGDLETIIAKAMEREPARRYPSAGALASDIRRFLSDEPIVARPATRLYHLSKFARRNRVLVGGLAATLVALAAGTAISTTLYFRSERARAGESAAKIAAVKSAKKASAVNEFILQRLLHSPDPGKDGRDVRVKDVLDSAAKGIAESFPDDPETQAQVRLTLASTYSGLGIFPAALEQAAAAFDLRERSLGPLHPDTLLALTDVGQAYIDLGRDDDAVSAMQEARRRLGGHEDLHDPVTLHILGTLADALQRKHQFDQAEALLRANIAARESAEPTDGLLHDLNVLAACLDSTQRVAEAADVQRRYYDLCLKLHGISDPATLAGLENLGQSLARLGRHAEAEPILKLALDNIARVVGPEHRLTGIAHVNYGQCLEQLGRTDQADAEYSKGVPIIQAAMGDAYLTENALNTHYSLLTRLGQFARADALIRERLAIRARNKSEGEEVQIEVLGAHILVLDRSSGCKEALAEAQAALALAQTVYPEGDARIARVRSWYGECLICLKRYAEAEPILLDCFRQQDAATGLPHRTRILTADMLTQLYDRMGRSDQAHHWADIADALDSTK